MATLKTMRSETTLRWILSGLHPGNTQPPDWLYKTDKVVAPKSVSKSKDIRDNEVFD